MERIFSNSLLSMGNTSEITVNTGDEDLDNYVYSVKALIEDAVDYEESELSYNREENVRYYKGLEPALPLDDGEEEEDIQQSTIVSTDVQDTVMAIMPSLMRIFASSEHVVNFMPRTANDIDLAKNQTNYIRYKFWDENNGFMILHSAIKDCLTVKVGITTWWSDVNHEPVENTYTNLHFTQVALIMEQHASHHPQIIHMTDITPDGMVESVTIRYVKSKPSLKVCAVPPDEFRISRNAKSVKDADCVGWVRLERASEVIARGFDPELVNEYTGESLGYSEERELRTPGIDTNNVLKDQVLFGEFYVRVDEDGDGINELHKITTLGGQYDIVDDYIVPRANFALFQSNPTPHTAIGECPTDLVKEIQKIRTNVLRSTMDSLADALNPRIAVNEMVTNVEDAMDPNRGTIIRTRGAPSEAVYPLVNPFVGAHGVEMLSYLDGVRQTRTGISEASKGIDPKVFQSTNEIGIDFVVSGAQERIELIARILAETGLKDMYIGMLNEVVDNPNHEEMIMVDNNFVEVNPSLFDASLRCIVNPTMSKGTDVVRLQAMEKVLELQLGAIEKFGIGNGVVGIGEIRNTIDDMMGIVNIKNVDRYFRPITPEQVEAIETAPKEPDAATLLAQAEMEKVKKDIVVAQAKMDSDEAKRQQDDDFRRDKLDVDSYISILDIVKDITVADAKHPDLERKNEPI